MLHVRFEQQKELIGMLALCTLISCAACHVIVLLRLPAIAEK
jgi:hypothetical protein